MDEGERRRRGGNHGDQPSTVEHTTLENQSPEHMRMYIIQFGLLTIWNEMATVWNGTRTIQNGIQTIWNVEWRHTIWQNGVGDLVVEVAQQEVSGERCHSRGVYSRVSSSLRPWLHPVHSTPPPTTATAVQNISLSLMLSL